MSAKEALSVANSNINIDFSEVAVKIEKYRSNGQKIGFVSGKFNIVHPGHLRLLKFGRDNCDILLVALEKDTDPGVSISGAQRAESLLALSLVDEVLLMDRPITEILEAIKPEVVIKGKEYAERDNIEEVALLSYGGQLLFSSGEVLFSSLALLKKELLVNTSSNITRPNEYLNRHQCKTRDLNSTVRNMSKAKVLVIGDLIVDTYITCDALGLSQEDPTIVVTPIDKNTFVGGAGIVAAHARGLGADVNFVTVVGKDSEASFAHDRLKQYGVTPHFIEDNSRPTTHKQRFRCLGKTLLRVSELRQHGVNSEIASQMLGVCHELIQEADVILFSDFNYGCLIQNVVNDLTQIGLEKGAIMAADSQASSQMADISRFKNMDFITPTEREARLALGDFDSGLSVIAENLLEKSKAKSIIITMGSEGLLNYSKSGENYLLDSLPALNRSPMDVAGAGDSLFATTSLGLYAGADIWTSTYLGAIAAACQVSRVGNLPLASGEILKELRH